MEHKQQIAEIKTLDGDLGGFTGYASTWENWDAVNEKPVRGAFGKSLSDFISNGFIALGHDWQSLPIATVKSAIEDEHGLLIDAEFHGTPAAQDARQVMNERLTRGKGAKLSIGYEVIKSSYVDDPKGGRLLEELALYEVSFVTVPANDQASILASKRLLLEGAPLHTYADQAEALLTAFTTEASATKERRAKEGRVLSDANRKRISSLQDALTAVLADLDELLTVTAPKSDTAKIRALAMQFQRINASIDGALPWAS